MVDLQELVKNLGDFYKIQQHEKGAVIVVPFFHWPEARDYYTVGIVEKDNKVFLTDNGTSRKYLLEKDVDILNYEERLEKIKKEFDLYDGLNGSFNLDIYQPNDIQFVMLSISRFLQAMTIITRIEL